MPVENDLESWRDQVSTILHFHQIAAALSLGFAKHLILEHHLIGLPCAFIQWTTASSRFINR